MSAPALKWPCLGLDTSTRDGVLVVADPEKKIQAVADLDSATTHGRDLIPALGRMMIGQGLEMKELGSIAVGIGPGSYTGLRVGLAVAKTLADVIDLPILPVDSLLLPVLNLPDDCLLAISIADAQRGAVYKSEYARANPGEKWQRISGPIIIPWNDLNQLASPAATITGPGLGLMQKLGSLELPIADKALWSPTAGSMLKWLREYAETTPPADRLAIEPLYIRPSAAEEKRQSQPTEANRA